MNHEVTQEISAEQETISRMRILDDLVAECDRDIAIRNRLTVGQLLASISREHLDGHAATEEQLLRVADVGKELLYAALTHGDMTDAVLDEARSLWGPLVDVAVRDRGVLDDHAAGRWRAGTDDDEG